MLRKALLTSCILLGAATASFGQVKLEHKFTEGGSYTTETIAKVEQTLVIAGMEVTTSADTRSVAKSTVGKRDAEGNLTVEEKTDALQINMSVQGMNYNFDSANADNKGDSQLELLRDVHKTLARRTTTTTYDKFDRATKVATDVNVLESLPAEIKALAGDTADPEKQKNEINQNLDQISRDAIKPGDTWKRTRTSNFGAGQSMTFETDYKYDGTVDKDGKKLDKVTSKTTSVKFALENSPLPVQIKNSELKVPESESTILFDRQAGHIVESSSTLRITGEMTFTINGMDLPAKLDLTIKDATTVK